MPYLEIDKHKCISKPDFDKRQWICRVNAQNYPSRLIHLYKASCTSYKDFYSADCLQNYLHHTLASCNKRKHAYHQEILGTADASVYVYYKVPSPSYRVLNKGLRVSMRAYLSSFQLNDPAHK